MIVAAIVLQLILCSYALGDDGVPKFTWIKTGNDKERTEEGNSLILLKLAITFPDGTEDVINFYNVQQIDGEDGQSCIMNGILEKEEDVTVVLTGGCNNALDFEITIVGSDKLQSPMFKVTQGQVEAIKLTLNQITDSEDDNKTPVDMFRRKAGKRSAWIKKKIATKQLDMEWYFDGEFSSQVGKGLASMLNIVAHAQAWFLHSSFPYNLRLQHHAIKYYNKTLYANDATLKMVEKDHVWSNDQNQAAIYVGVRGVFSRFGYSNKGTICSDRTKAIGIILHESTVAGSGLSAAVHLAYLLGIKDDSGRNDSDGHSCQDSAYMMYGTYNPKRWSGCSSDDIQGRMKKGELSCLTDYQCHDQFACQKNKKSDCKGSSKTIFELSCPKMCGIC